jgi:hypothetical protein
LEHINAVQDKLNKTTDDITRDSLMKEIGTLKTQIQTLERAPATPVVQPATPPPASLETPVSATRSIPQAAMPTDKLQSN